MTMTFSVPFDSAKEQDSKVMWNSSRLDGDDVLNQGQRQSQSLELENCGKSNK